MLIVNIDLLYFINHLKLILYINDIKQIYNVTIYSIYIIYELMKFINK